MPAPSDLDSDLSSAHRGSNCGSSLRTRVRALRDRMGRLSRDIGIAREHGESTRDLIEEMKSISAECKRLEKQLKESDPASRHHPVVSAAESCGDAPKTVGANVENLVSTAPHTRQAQDSARTNLASEWDTYVLDHPRSSPYHLLCWKVIIESSFGHETHYLTARNEHGNLAGILPLVRQKSLLFGDFLISIPFLNYGGPLGDDPQVEAALMKQASELASRLGCTHAEFRDTLRRPGWPVRTDKVSMRLDLPDSVQALWRSFPSKLRSQIRRADREAPTVLIGGRELLGDFYKVFSRNMRDLGTPTYDMRFFEQVTGTVETNANIVILRLGTDPVSAGIVISHKERLEIPWASTIKPAMPMAMNMFFYWVVLRYAIESGHHEFDFGRSTRESGTYQFKKQWGAHEFPMHWHYWLKRDRPIPRMNPDNPKYRAAISFWKRLPMWLTNLAGPLIARRLP